MTVTQPTPADWPEIVYGTAWKGERTAELVRLALACGYRAVDTAGQPKHYYEPGVGAGIASAFDELKLQRDDLFLQTKFSPVMAQGCEIPYDTGAPSAEQVEQSLDQSLTNLGTEYLDSYLLHAPQGARGLADADWAIWEALEAAYERGQVRRIGISNAAVPHLEELLTHARIPPVAVQNRCFARDGWNRDVRALCAEHGIAYQGFSLLTANPGVAEDATVQKLANQLEATPAQIVFAFARAVGMVPLTGTTSEQHMADDLAACELSLDADAVAAVERVGL
ncbi:aldo/keto reductase [Salinisphaera sp. PC39]|uniref:aldo/keto reductase family protein n=1 Tax=Salinisphaera sp. PC39 TaxID=1304156 RepID=UPI0033404AF1